jgi:hypothetical protein
MFMSKTKLSFLVTLLLSTYLSAADSHAFVPETVLQHLVVLGASVSAGYFPSGNPQIQETPASRLLRRYTFPTSLVDHAVSGQNLEAAWNEFTATERSQATLVVGADWFFWNSTTSGRNCATAAADADTDLEALTAKHIPWIVGLIPDLSGAFTNYHLVQPCRDALNESLKTHCSVDANCRLLDMPSMYGVLRTQGSVTYRGHTYTQVTDTDGLHLTPEGTTLLTDVIQGAIENSSAAPFVIFGGTSVPASAH